MKIVFLLTFFLFIVLLSSYSEVLKEKPLFSIGCDFLSLTDEKLSAIVLFNNTNIYVDLNNDFLWDYSFNDSAGKTINLVLPNGNYPAAGSRIYSNKPIWLKQNVFLYYKKNDITNKEYSYEYDITIPQISNAASKYVAFDTEISLLSNQNTRVLVNGSYIDLNSNEKKDVKISPPTLIQSEKPLYVYSKRGLQQIPSKDFYADFDKVNISIIENNTKIYFDFDLDGYFDYNKTFESGFSNISFTKNAVHMWSDKEFGVSSKYSSVLDLNYIYYPLNPSFQISNEYFTFSSNTPNSVPNSFFTAIFVSENNSNIIGDITELSLQQVYKYVPKQLSHVVGELPFLSKEYFSGVVDQKTYIYESSHNPSPDIVLIQYPKEKKIVSNSNVTTLTRIFNTYKRTEIENLSVNIYSDNSFAFFENSTKVSIKNIENDKIIEEITNYAIENTNNVLISISKLLPYTYLEIEINTPVPSKCQIYKFTDVSFSYVAKTWSS